MHPKSCAHEFETILFNGYPVGEGGSGSRYEFGLCATCAALRVVRFGVYSTTTAIYYPDAPHGV